MAQQRTYSGPNLAAGATATVGPFEVGLADRITGSAFLDQAGTLKIEQSADLTNWDISSSIVITASDGSGFSEEAVLAYARVTLTNDGASTTTAVRITVRTTTAGSR